MTIKFSIKPADQVPKTSTVPPKQQPILKDTLTKKELKTLNKIRKNVSNLYKDKKLSVKGLSKFMEASKNNATARTMIKAHEAANKDSLLGTEISFKAKGNSGIKSNAEPSLNKDSSFISDGSWVSFDSETNPFKEKSAIYSSILASPELSDSKTTSSIMGSTSSEKFHIFADDSSIESQAGWSSGTDSSSAIGQPLKPREVKITVVSTAAPQNSDNDSVGSYYSYAGTTSSASTWPTGNLSTKDTFNYSNKQKTSSWSLFKGFSKIRTLLSISMSCFTGRRQP